MASEVDERVLSILGKAKVLAKEYYSITGRPLGITGEVGEYEAARLLSDIELAPVRQDGFDALRRVGHGVTRLQIKARCYPAGHKEQGQRIGSIQLGKPWDAVLLVLLDPDFEAREIWEAGRPALTAALLAPGSVARIERGALSVAKFRAIGRLVWSRREEGCP